MSMGKDIIFTRCQAPGEASRPPAFLRFRSSKVFIVFAVSFAIFTDTLLYGLIIPVVPTALHERAGLSMSDEQRWTSILLALYSASTLVFAPISGYIADRFESRRWPMMAGLVILGTATALLCVGSHIALWIIGRLLQGSSAAVIWAVGCALLADSVERGQVGKAFSFVGVALTLGYLVGPLVGGVLYEQRGYYSIFGLAFALIGVDLVFRLAIIERKDALKWTQASNGAGQDKETGMPAHSVCLSENVQSPGDGDGDLQRPEPRDGGNHERGRDQAFQRKGPRPIWLLLSSPRMWVALCAYAVVAILVGAFDSVLPLFVQDTFGWAQTAQGLTFLAISLPHVLDPVVGIINDRYETSRRYLAGAAFLVSTPVCVCLRFVTTSSIGDKVLLCALVAILGSCMSFMETPLITEIFYIISEMEAQAPAALGEKGATALAYGLMSSAFAAGTLVGPILAGFIRDVAGWGTMSWVLGLLTGVTAVPVLFSLGGFPGRLSFRQA